MSKRLYREFYLLPRGEQRALLILSVLLILSLIFRIAVSLLPDREPAGLEEFEQEARLLLTALEEADSLRQLKQDSLRGKAPGYPSSVYFSHNQNAKNFKAQPVDINRADSSDLLPLPGIGPVFAGRIIKYRKLLGGFVSVDQLGEVYGIPVETVQKIGSMLFIDSSAIRKIQIDSASFRELLRHPYLEYEHVKSLVEYRDFRGEINSARELMKNHILPDTTLSKIDVYFEYR